MENRQTAAIVSINHLPIAPAGILPARHTIAGLDAPPIAPWPRPFPLSLGSPHFRGPRRPAAPCPTPPDTVAASPGCRAPRNRTWSDHREKDRDPAGGRPLTTPACL